VTRAIHSGDSLRKRAAGAEFALELERVPSRAVLEREWLPLLAEIFPDRNDREPKTQLLERFRRPRLNLFFLLRDARRGRAVGLELRQLDPARSGASYLPWAGLVESHRNRGIYPRMMEICDSVARKAGAKYCLFEAEDPERISIAYPEEPPARSRRRAEDRIRFWRRHDSWIVRPSEEGAVYIRPASSDPRKIQAYDLMAFRVLDEAGPVWGEVFNRDRSAISKTAYRRFYLEMMRIQYGGRTEAGIRRELPAVDRFLASLDACRARWLRLETGLVPPRRRKEAPIGIELL
jgi:hypothetical protein